MTGEYRIMQIKDEEYKDLPAIEQKLFCTYIIVAFLAEKGPIFCRFRRQRTSQKSVAMPRNP